MTKGYEQKTVLIDRMKRRTQTIALTNNQVFLFFQSAYIYIYIYTLPLSQRTEKRNAIPIINGVNILVAA